MFPIEKWREYMNSNKEIIVSVIIPTYKRSDMLLRAIDSVLNQSFTNVQVIVVDDNDPDTEYRQNTKNRMQRYKNNSRVRYVQHAHNMNGSAARNTGIKLSDGEYVCFLDDDDFFSDDKIEKQVRFLEEHPIYSAVCCDYIKNGKRISFPRKDNYTEDILLLKPVPQTSGILFKKKAVDHINGFDDTFIRHQDFELMLRFFDAGFKIGKIDEALYTRDVSGVSNIPSGQKMETIKEKFLKQFEDIIEKIEEKDPGFKRRVYSIHYEKIMKSYIKEKNVKKALVYMWKSILLNPRSFVCEIENEVTSRVKK